MPFIIDRPLYFGENVPLKYHLRFELRNNLPVFLLDVYSEIVKSIPDHFIAVANTRFPNIGEFTNTSESLGFGQVLKNIEPRLETDEFSSWEVALPDGISGPPGQRTTNMLPATQVACTLSIITYAAQIAQPKPNKLNLQQLASYTLVCQPNMGGFGLGATLSASLRRYICYNRARLHSKIRESMTAAYKHMWPDYFDRDLKYRLSLFQVRDNSSDGTGLSLDIPGNACGLYCDVNENYGDKTIIPGWNFDCHNVDSPIQQLSLVAGPASVLYEYLK